MLCEFPKLWKLTGNERASANQFNARAGIVHYDSSNNSGLIKPKIQDAAACVG